MQANPQGSLTHEYYRTSNTFLHLSYELPPVTKYNEYQTESMGFKFKTSQYIHKPQNVSCNSMLNLKSKLEYFKFNKQI